MFFDMGTKKRKKLIIWGFGGVLGLNLWMSGNKKARAQHKVTPGLISEM